MAYEQSSYERTIRELISVGSNYRPNEGGPWQLFASLTGYDDGGDGIGYLEAGVLGRALAAWAENPALIFEVCDRVRGEE